MRGLRWRKSITRGPFRATASRRGISRSVRVGPFRYTRRADGGRQITLRLPLGFHYTMPIGGNR